MNKIYYYLIAMLIAVALPAAAQTDDTDIQEEDIPFGLQEAEEDDADTFFESNFLISNLTFRARAWLMNHNASVW